MADSGISMADSGISMADSGISGISMADSGISMADSGISMADNVNNREQFCLCMICFGWNESGERGDSSFGFIPCHIRLNASDVHVTLSKS